MSWQQPRDEGLLHRRELHLDGEAAGGERDGDRVVPQLAALQAVAREAPG